MKKKSRQKKSPTQSAGLHKRTQLKLARFGAALRTSLLDKTRLREIAAQLQVTQREVRRLYTGALERVLLGVGDCGFASTFVLLCECGSLTTPKPIRYRRPPPPEKYKHQVDWFKWDLPLVNYAREQLQKANEGTPAR